MTTSKEICGFRARLSAEIAGGYKITESIKPIASACSTPAPEGRVLPVCVLSMLPNCLDTHGFGVYFQNSNPSSVEKSTL